MVAQLKSQPPRLTRWPEICSQDWCAVLRAAPIRTTQAKKGEEHASPEITPITIQAENIVFICSALHRVCQSLPLPIIFPISLIKCTKKSQNPEFNLLSYNKGKQCIYTTEKMANDSPILKTVVHFIFC